MKKLWFRARRYGWGWTPCSVEGWVVTIATAVLLIAGDLAIVLLAIPKRPPQPLQAVGCALAWNAVIAGAAIAISWATGERPRWRWGGPD
jgi:hypothetical protein